MAFPFAPVRPVALNESVKDVLGQCVKDVMRLNTSARHAGSLAGIRPSYCYRRSGSSIHGGVASMSRPNSGSTSSIFTFISHAISR
jgi:hypothetical protein